MRMEVGSYLTLNDNHSRALRGKNNLTAVSGSWKSAREFRTLYIPECRMAITIKSNLLSSQARISRPTRERIPSTKKTSKARTTREQASLRAWAFHCPNLGIRASIEVLDGRCI